MSLIRWEPFMDIERLFGFDFPRFGMENFCLDLAADIYEDDGKVVAEMQLPGIDPERIDISPDGDYLKVSGSREEEKEKKGKDHYSREIRCGSFEWSVRLPKPVLAGGAEASYECWILKVVLPIRGPAAGKEKIKVRAKMK